VDSLGAVPSYYLRYFYLHDTVVEDERDRRTRAEEVAEARARVITHFIASE
jgi:6-phospho-beta-glucosidase